MSEGWLKSILRNVWRGAAFGAMLSYIASQVMVLPILIYAGFEVGAWSVKEFMIGFLLYGLGIIGFMWMILGGGIGGFLGIVFSFAGEETTDGELAFISPVFSSAIHFIIYSAFEIVSFIGPSMGYSLHYEGNVLQPYYSWLWIPLWVCYLGVAVIFGYRFRRVRIWLPAFLRD